AWVPQGNAILARLSVHDQAVAVLYGFVSGSKFDFYQSGVKTSGIESLRSPGNLAHLLLLRELGRRGIQHYDSLRGSASYKDRLATVERRLVSLHAWRPSFGTVLYRSTLYIRRAVGKVFGRLRRI